MVKAIIVLLLVFFSGCTVVRHSQQISTLRKVGASQKQMQSYVARQEKGFNRLRKDIERKRLKVGISQREVVSLYGEPILEKEVGDKIQWLYRHPTEYFNSDRAYLYFNSSNTLIGWEFDKKEEKDQEEE